jgi:hypothetical protein
MIKAKVIWPPYPYLAGFCISDDADCATFQQVKSVYDFLIECNFVTTKSVWPFTPVDNCGLPPTPKSTLRGITLENKDYLRYCKKLSLKGYEICLHGASAGNNKRDSIINAINYFKQHFCNTDTYICHSKNADNLYWENKVTSRFPFNLLLKMYSKYSCSGEISSSQFFWGDICSSSVKQIRLFKTRHIDTLSRSPSMPYYDLKKPYVNSWFSATKRSLADCASNNAIYRLKHNNGLTVLYQYLHRYADPYTNIIQDGFQKSIMKLCNDSGIYNNTVSNILNRLRQLQEIFILHDTFQFYIINIGKHYIKNFQIVLNLHKGVLYKKRNDGIKQIKNRLIIKKILPESITCYKLKQPISFKNNNRCFSARKSRMVLKQPFGRLYINLTKFNWNVIDKVLLPFSFQVENTNKTLSGIPIRSILSPKEEYRLLIDQFGLILREILFKRRNLNINKYLDSSKPIILENHDNW